MVIQENRATSRNDFFLLKIIFLCLSMVPRNFFCVYLFEVGAGRGRSGPLGTPYDLNPIFRSWFNSAVGKKPLSFNLPSFITLRIC
jgi:hypothetical protein